jgi:hypothetical protein
MPGSIEGPEFSQIPLHGAPSSRLDARDIGQAAAPGTKIFNVGQS